MQTSLNKVLAFLLLGVYVSLSRTSNVGKLEKTTAVHGRREVKFSDEVDERIFDKNASPSDVRSRGRQASQENVGNTSKKYVDSTKLQSSLKRSPPSSKSKSTRSRSDNVSTKSTSILTDMVQTDGSMLIAALFLAGWNTELRPFLENASWQNSRFISFLKDNYKRLWQSERPTIEGLAKAIAIEIKDSVPDVLSKTKLDQIKSIFRRILDKAIQDSQKIGIHNNRPVITIKKKGKSGASRALVYGIGKDEEYSPGIVVPYLQMIPKTALGQVLSPELPIGNRLYKVKASVWNDSYGNASVVIYNQDGHDWQYICEQRSGNVTVRKLSMNPSGSKSHLSEAEKALSKASVILHLYQLKGDTSSSNFASSSLISPSVALLPTRIIKELRGISNKYFDNPKNLAHVLLGIFSSIVDGVKNYGSNFEVGDFFFYILKWMYMSVSNIDLNFTKMQDKFRKTTRYLMDNSEKLKLSDNSKKLVIVMKTGTANLLYAIITGSVQIQPIFKLLKSMVKRFLRDSSLIVDHATKNIDEGKVRQLLGSFDSVVGTNLVKVFNSLRQHLNRSWIINAGSLSVKWLGWFASKIYAVLEATLYKGLNIVRTNALALAVSRDDEWISKEACPDLLPAKTNFDEPYCAIPLLTATKILANLTAESSERKAFVDFLKKILPASYHSRVIKCSKKILGSFWIYPTVKQTPPSPKSDMASSSAWSYLGFQKSDKGLTEQQKKCSKALLSTSDVMRHLKSLSLKYSKNVRRFLRNTYPLDEYTTMKNYIKANIQKADEKN